MSDLQLIEAVKAADLAAGRAVIEAGADVNQQDEQGWTALNWAAGKGDVAFIRLLLANGADVFKVGRDQRTAYLIALAAARVEAMRLLRDAEEKEGGERKSSGQDRKYCKAYQLKELRRFPDWPQNVINRKKQKDNKDVGHTEGDDKDLSDEDVVFVHHNLVVTQSPWENEDVLFDLVTPEWKQFCTDTLKFKVADDFDLLAPPVDVNNDEPARENQ